MTDETETILPCLWCKRESGGFPPRLNTANGTMHWVFCPECGMHGPSGIGEDKAIEHWNFICRPQSAPDKGAVAWMNPSDHDTGFTRQKPDDMTGWLPLYTVPRFSALDELAQRWLDEANEKQGNPLEIALECQKRICADELKQILKSPLFRPFASPAQAPVARDAEARVAVSEAIDRVIATHYEDTASSAAYLLRDHIWAQFSNFVPAAPSLVSVPGWKLVPIQRTPEMGNACVNAITMMQMYPRGNPVGTGPTSLADAIWEAMLSAAPQAIKEGDKP